MTVRVIERVGRPTRREATRDEEGTMMVASMSRQSFCCDYCGQSGTTVAGGLWKTSEEAHAPLYYLHSRCLLSYKAARGLRSVEGRLPLTTGKRPRVSAERTPYLGDEARAQGWIA